MGTFESLEDKVIDWALDKGILPDGNIHSQGLKVAEEVGEFLGAVAKGRLDEAAHELGDVLVTLILTAELAGLDLSDCLELAYLKINNRNGVMRNGVFIKEGD